MPKIVCYEEVKSLFDQIGLQMAETLLLKYVKT